MRNARAFEQSTVLALAFLVLLPVTAGAQQRQFERERASVIFGVFSADRDSATRLDSGTGVGTDIDLEDDLGLESRTNVARLGGYVWIKRRQRLDFSLFDLSRTASRRIEQTLTYGDQTFDVDTRITSDANLTILKADYTFAPIMRQRGYFGVTGGLYTAAFELSLSEPTLGTAESEDLTAPLPVLGFRGEYAVGERFTVRAAAQWFRVDTGDAGGRLRDSYVGVDYGVGRRMAIGLAYNDVTMNVTAEEPGGFMGRVDWGYDGWLLYIKGDLGVRIMGAASFTLQP